MRQLARPIRLDFVAPVHQAPLAGAGLLIMGLAASLAVGIAFHRTLAERSRLEDELGATAQPRHGPPTPESIKRASEAATVERELGVPWTRLLAELEAASQDTANSVSLLLVEPDPKKQVVRITAEVRALPDAIAYLKRLQKSEVLRYPMLESHERRKDDPQHPVRIKLSAEWRT
jgi:anion-transporting  ArsA/GET3 family ATPase